MARKGRKPKSRDQKLRDAFERTKPADYVLERRALFSFVEAPKGGEIDSEVCDAIGQLCALGLLDDNGYDPVELRDKGRFWGGHYAKLMKGVGVRTGAYERRDRSTPTGALTGDDLLFDRIDECLAPFERSVLLSLVVDPLIGHHETVPWAQCLIDEALLKRGRIRRGVTEFPSLNDRHLLNAAIRGLCQLCEGSLRPRWERSAA
jgi:hypothetical protein